MISTKQDQLRQYFREKSAEYRVRYPERVSNSLRKWRENNKDKITAYRREWQQKERARRTAEKQADMNAYANEYYAKHKKRIKDNTLRAYQSLTQGERDKKREEHTRRVRLRRRANPVKTKLDNAARRSRIKHVHDGTVTTQFLRELLIDTTHCPYCDELLDGNDQHFDHKQPIALGGIHSQSNILLCCGACNRRKGSLPYEAWMERIATGVNTGS
jgi:5-methylcytosine-specific restriction endonuclease McrA